MAAQGSSGRSLTLVLWGTILAAPLALVLETGLRALIFPPEFELFREFLAPFLTPTAWAAGLLAGVAALLGAALQARMTTGKIARLGPDASAEQRLQQALSVFLLTSSVPQIPAVGSTFLFMFGASLTPVLVGIGLCTVGVLVQAARVRALAA